MFNCCDCRKEQEVTTKVQHGAEGPKCGCGIIFTTNTKGALIVDGLVPGGSAEAGGQIEVGDVLMQVDGINVYRKPVGLVGPLLLGPPGSTVTIVVMRGDEQLDVALTRRPANQASPARQVPIDGKAPVFARN